MPNRKLILYISSSVDGFISKPGDDLSFLKPMHVEGEDYGYADFVSSIDTVIMGRKTYDWVMKVVDAFPHADKEAYIITRSQRPSIGTTHFYNGDLTELVTRLKKQQGKNIYCDGGAHLVNELLRLDLIDELIVSVVPVLLGEGVQLFQTGIPERTLKLKSVKEFQTGMVQYHYAVIK
jgi:dihydrofolate reductase